MSQLLLIPPQISGKQKEPFIIRHRILQTPFFFSLTTCKSFTLRAVIGPEEFYVYWERCSRCLEIADWMWVSADGVRR